MALRDDFGLHINLHLESLESLRNGIPENLPAQCEEIATVLQGYDVAVERIVKDSNLSPLGKATQLQAARDAAQDSIEQWKAGKVIGLDSQMSATRSALAIPPNAIKPTDLQITNMVQRLAAFDPFEVEILYADATDAERMVIEAAADAIGRQPAKRGDKIVWEPLLSPERITAGREARIERANPDAVAGLRDLQRIRNTYETLAGSATGLLKESTSAVRLAEL